MAHRLAAGAEVAPAHLRPGGVRYCGNLLPRPLSHGQAGVRPAAPAPLAALGGDKGPGVCRRVSGHSLGGVGLGGNALNRRAGVVVGAASSQHDGGRPAAQSKGHAATGASSLPSTAGGVPVAVTEAVANGAASAGPHQLYRQAVRRQLAQKVAQASPAASPHFWSAAFGLARTGWGVLIGFLIAVAVQLVGTWLTKQRWALQLLQQLGLRRASGDGASTSQPAAGSSSSSSRASGGRSSRASSRASSSTSSSSSTPYDWAVLGLSDPDVAGSSSPSSSGTMAISGGTTTDASLASAEPGETVEWVNMCWRKAWRVYQRGLERWLQDLLQPVFDGLVRDKQVPSFVHRLRIVEFSLDHDAPYFSSMRRRSSRKDSDLSGVVELRYTGGARMLLMLDIGWGRYRFKLPVMVSDLDLDAPMLVRLRLAPLCPWIGTISLAFVGRPNVKVQLSPYNRVQLMRVPVVQAFLKKLFTVDLPNLMVLPRKLEINIPPSVTSVAEAAVGRDVIMRAVASAVLQADALENALMGALPLGPQTAAGGIALPDSFQGELTVKLREARDLPVQAFRWMSNPLCRLTLGEQTVASRREGDTSEPGVYAAPVWNQEFQFLVEDPGKQVLQLYVRDNNLMGVQVDIARGSFQLDALSADGRASCWVPLVAENGRLTAGALLLDVTYKSFEEEDRDARLAAAQAAVEAAAAQAADGSGTPAPAASPAAPVVPVEVIKDVPSAAAASSRAAVAASAAAAAIAMTKAAAARAAARAAQAAQAAAETASSIATGAAAGVASSVVSSSPKPPPGLELQTFDEESGAPEGWVDVGPKDEDIKSAAEQLMSAAAATNGVLPGFDTDIALLEARFAKQVEARAAAAAAAASAGIAYDSDADIAASNAAAAAAAAAAAGAAAPELGATALSGSGTSNSFDHAAPAAHRFGAAATTHAAGAEVAGDGGGQEPDVVMNDAAEAARRRSAELRAASAVPVSAAVALAHVPPGDQQQQQQQQQQQHDAAAAADGMTTVTASVDVAVLDSQDVVLVASPKYASARPAGSGGGDAATVIDAPTAPVASAALVAAVVGNGNGNGQHGGHNGGGNGNGHAPLDGHAHATAAAASGLIVVNGVSPSSTSGLGGSGGADSLLQQHQLPPPLTLITGDGASAADGGATAEQPANAAALKPAKAAAAAAATPPPTASEAAAAALSPAAAEVAPKEEAEAAAAAEPGPSWWHSALQKVSRLVPQKATDLVDNSEKDALAAKREEAAAKGAAAASGEPGATSSDDGSGGEMAAAKPLGSSKPWWAFWSGGGGGSGSADAQGGDNDAQQSQQEAAARAASGSAASTSGKGPVETIILPADLPIEEIAKEVAKIKEESQKAQEDHVSNLWRAAVEKNNRTWLYLLCFLLTVAIGLLTVVVYKLDHTASGGGGDAAAAAEQVAQSVPLAFYSLLWYLLRL